MIILRKVVNIIINLFVIIISKCFPRDPKIWIFGAWFGETFSDNSKYLFLYCHNNKDKLNLNKVIWVTNSNDIYKELKKDGIKVVKRNSIKSVWYHLRAKYHIICQSTEDINSYFSANAIRIQLWHGVGLKRLVIDKEIDTNSFQYKIKYLVKLISSKGLWYRYKFLSVSNFATQNLYMYGFRLWENDIINSNYPRNMYLLNREYCKEYMRYVNEYTDELINLIKILKKDHKIILYTPTYRGRANIKNEYIDIYPLNIKNKIEFEEFINYLEENNLYFITKYHFAGELKNIKNIERLINIPKSTDIYDILEHVDLLITDYSSIYSDFLLMNKPIIFYIYDFLEYKNKDKGFLLNFYDFTPGDKVETLNDLKTSILSNLIEDNYKSERMNIKNILFEDSLKYDFNDLVNKIMDV